MVTPLENQQAPSPHQPGPLTVFNMVLPSLAFQRHAFPCALCKLCNYLGHGPTRTRCSLLDAAAECQEPSSSPGWSGSTSARAAWFKWLWSHNRECHKCLCDLHLNSIFSHRSQKRKLALLTPDLNFVPSPVSSGPQIQMLAPRHPRHLQMPSFMPYGCLCDKWDPWRAQMGSSFLSDVHNLIHTPTELEWYWGLEYQDRRGRVSSSMSRWGAQHRSLV